MWLCHIVGYKYSIVYCPRKQNIVVDALSRRDEPQLMSFTTPISTLGDDIKEASQVDPTYKELWNPLLVEPE